MNKKKDGTPDKRFYPNHIRKKKSPKKPIILHGICQCKSCKAIRKKNNKKELIYMDPPYHRASPNLYGTSPWKEVDFVKLRNDFHELSCLGFKVILSMSDTPFIRELFKGYNMKEIPFSYRANQRKKVMELVITNYGDLELKKVIRKVK